MRTSDHSFRTSKRALTIHSTHQLLRAEGLDVRGGKTGVITQSGYCLATLLRLPDLNQTIAVVVLGAKSNAERFWETRHLFNWIAGKAPGLLARDGGQKPVHPPPAPDQASRRVAALHRCRIEWLAGNRVDIEHKRPVRPARIVGTVVCHHVSATIRVRVAADRNTRAAVCRATTRRRRR